MDRKTRALWSIWTCAASPFFAKNLRRKFTTRRISARGHCAWTTTRRRGAWTRQSQATCVSFPTCATYRVSAQIRGVKPLKPHEGWVSEISWLSKSTRTSGIIDCTLRAVESTEIPEIRINQTHPECVFGQWLGIIFFVLGSVVL